MTLFLLLTDLVILAVYGGYALVNFQDHFGFILMILLFFMAARVLALSVHRAFSAVNLALIYFLWPYQPLLLLSLYLFYAALYAFLSHKEALQRRLTQENTRLQVEQKNSRRYLFLKESYDSQIAQNTRLEERRAIAQQIHDLLGHSLTAAVLQLEAAGEVMDGDPEKAKKMLGSAAGMLRTGVSQVREAVHQMRADVPMLKQSELRAAADRFRLDSGILTRYHEEGDLSGLPGSIWQVILANLREALTNVIRHAGATEVEIRLQALPGMIRLEVHDNGRGCEKPVEGMGLSGMRERAAEYGGSLILRSDQGMRVITLIPRKAAEDDSRNRD